MFDCRELRGWCTLLMDSHVNFRTFLQLRAVCKQLYDASCCCQKQWYYWLDTRGARVEVIRVRHANAPHECEQFEHGQTLCMRQDHYRDVTTKPRLLKTVPLHEQVMRQVLKQQRKQLRSVFRNALSLHDSMLDNIAHQRKRLHQAAKDLDTYDRISDAILTEKRFRSIDFGLEDF